MTAAEATPVGANSFGQQERPPAEPAPVEVVCTEPEKDLAMLGRMAREVLEGAKMPRHLWFKETSAWELIMTALGRYKRERGRLLAQRTQLRQLHKKVLELKGELAVARGTSDNLRTALESAQKRIEEMQRNR